MYSTRVHGRSMGRPTREDVAKIVNVSGATVSRVLSGRTDIPISPETREKVIEAAKKIGYMPNAAARALNNVPTGLIGLWMSLHYSRYRGQVLEEMRAILGETEMGLAVTDVDEEYRWDHNFVRALRTPVDGIIAFDNSVALTTFAAQRDRVAPATPFVSMGAYWSERLSFVGIDLAYGAKIAMRHLLDTGRKNIAYLVPGHSGLDVWGPRFDAYREGMEELGRPMQKILTRHDEVEEIMEALTAFKAQGELPDAIYCMSDDLALSAHTSIYRLGMRPGHDIAVIGFDGIKETQSTVCPLTTVRQPMNEMCRLAVEFLANQIHHPSAPLRQQILKPELVIRESTCP